jgi:ABC-type lipoprotein release transport system permease subunit
VGAVALRLRAESRASWRAWLVLALLIGIFAGAVLGVAIGARRTATAFPRLVNRARSSDVLVGAYTSGAIGYYNEVAHDPRVQDYALVAGLPVFPVGPDGRPVPFAGSPLAATDSRFGSTLDRPLILSGRLPRPNRADEVLVNDSTARQLHVRVGSRLPLMAAQFDPAAPGGDPIATVPFTTTVVGLGRLANEVVPTARFDTTPFILLTPAAYELYGKPPFILNFDGLFVRLHRHQDAAAFIGRAKALAAARAEEVGGDVLVTNYGDRNARVERAIRPQAIALALFAMFAGLTGFLVIGQALSRQLNEDATEVPILRTLGFTRPQLVRLALLRTALVAGVAVPLALVIAVGMSPLFPIGASRRALVTVGVEANWAFLAGGGAVIVLLFLARAVLPAWRLASVPAGVHGAAAADAGRPAAAWLTSRLPASAATGVRMALEPGRGRTAVPVRTTLVGAIVALAAVATTLTFAANLSRLVNTPRLYGRSWDVLYDGSFGALPRDRVEPLLHASPAVASFSGGYYGEASVAGRPVTAVGIRGAVRPAIVAGRAPVADDEVVLGGSTLAHAHRTVGQRVDVELAGATRSMKVVGRAVFPAMGRGSFAQTGLGDGMLTTDAVVTPPPSQDLTVPSFNFYLLRLRPDAKDADVQALTRALLPWCPPDQDCVVRSGHAGDVVERPAEITNLDRIRWTPVVLAGVLAALAVATVGHTLVTSIRRRRRDLALLKTIGFQRGQISATVAWQATTFATVALIGLPLGLALGRVLWRALANQLGIVPDVATPSLALLVAVPATIILANLVAVIPGWVAGRIRPATALRAE